MALNFHRRTREEPEINLIPFIDVLLVVLIFLMLSTTYSRLTEMQLRLPAADTEALREHPREIVVAVSSDGRYTVNRQSLSERGVVGVAQALADAARDRPDAMVVISADAGAAHQAVVTVMEAARRAGLQQITFATQSSGAKD